MTLQEQCFAAQEKIALAKDAALQKKITDLAKSIHVPSKEDIERAASQGNECVIGMFTSQACPFGNMTLANAIVLARARTMHGELSKQLTIGFMSSGLDDGDLRCATYAARTPTARCGWSDKTLRLDKR